MIKTCVWFCIFSFIGATPALATITLSTSSSDYQLVNVVSDVDFFDIEIEIDADLASGVFNNPEIIRVDYEVAGNLIAGTPSGFPSFHLQREISGADFYAQGSSLSFEIADFADLSDGVQADELLDTGTILSFNGREIDNGRFHPAILTLYFGGTGRIQNSNNIVRQYPLLEVDFGEEYVNDLSFAPASLTLIDTTPEDPAAPVEPMPKKSSGSSSLLWLLILSLFIALRSMLSTKRAPDKSARG